MAATGVFPFTEFLWLAADDITIETADGNGDRHAQADYCTDGDFLPGRSQLEDTRMAWRNEDISGCCCYRSRFDTLCGLSARRVILAPQQHNSMLTYNLEMINMESELLGGHHGI
jgi:hypothetical protein